MRRPKLANRLVDHSPWTTAITVLTLVLSHQACGALNSAAVRILQAAETGSNVDQAALAAAWRTVSDADIDDLPLLLRAFDDATPVGVNWLSSAMDRVLQEGKSQGRAPTADQLEAYVLDASNGPRGREVALELLGEQHEDDAERVSDKLIDDSAARLRRPAVARMIQRAAEESESQEQLRLYQRAFAAALDEDHVVATAVALRKLGHPVDHIRKFGFLMHWQIIGPFAYEDGKGFDTAYPPETLDLNNYAGPHGIFSEATMAGKPGENETPESVSWTKYVNTSRNGVVDLNKAVGELRDAVAYGATVFASNRQQAAQLRLRQQNSAKVWLNGALVFSQPIGHTGNFFDQYTVPVTLRKGPNLIVVKSCQFAGPVYHPFVGAWQFCVRVTDATGNAILATNRPPTPELDPLPKPPTEKQEDDEAPEASDVQEKDDTETSE